MGQPPQRHKDSAQRAERDAKIFRLKVAGMSERAIAKQIGTSPTTVHRVVSEVARHTVQVPAEEFRDLEAARLDAALVHATAIMNDRKAMDADRLKAALAVVRISESRRRMFGADAPVSMDVALNARLENSAELITETIAAVLDAVELPGPMKAYAFEYAAWLLGGKSGDLPVRPAPPQPAPEPMTEPQFTVERLALPAATGEPDDVPEAELVEDDPEPPKPQRPTARRHRDETDPDAEARQSWPGDLRRRLVPGPGSALAGRVDSNPFNSPR